MSANNNNTIADNDGREEELLRCSVNSDYIYEPTGPTDGGESELSIIDTVIPEHAPAIEEPHPELEGGLDSPADYQPQQAPVDSDASGGGSESVAQDQSGALDDDDHSGEIREYTGVFEGPEKTLEVVFRRVTDTDEEEPQLPQQANAHAAAGQEIERIGLRRLNRADLDRICARARCTILSCVSNQYLDAYVLSESSLFVYPYMLVLKTCGTTTLLRCLAVLIELGRRLGLELDWMGYSRKNFNYPGDQAFPHQSFHQELDYLYSHRNLCERLDGNGYTLGPVTDDHWFVFVADQTIRSRNNDTLDTDRVLNIMMFDIDESVAEIFFYDAYEKKIRPDETEEEAVKRISVAQTKAAGIDALCPGSIIDPRAFEPCGYSMNAILFRSYCTMHITPESGSSYASFETNQKVCSYTSLINNVVRAFKPKRFVLTLMADEAGMSQMRENPLAGSAAAAKIAVPTAPVSSGAKDKQSKMSPNLDAGASPAKKMVYKRTNLASIHVEDDQACMMGNWVLHEEESTGVPGPRLRGMSVS
eukprot:CAMPEP_0181074630 /NCGR_PEP_ID=MMETSP1070-20121207/29697_1 /TAXON_ID=265543 /ORGANISM="Minutocellus polymorphus, Strain NH13" /LENGTH=532 /DNA_ID=CAMNT_0023155745 /DNA_START=243 /DNA_END=1841 /DNA_ORIENTATION=+